MNSRIEFVDTLKVLAIFGVITIHTGLMQLRPINGKAFVQSLNHNI